jgi:signal transduction histidine kinase
MWKLKKGKNFYLVFSVMGLLVSLSVCTIMYFQFRKIVQGYYFGELANVAKMIEKQCPALYDIDSMKEGLLENEDWVWDIHRGWEEIVEAFGLAYIYYVERSPGGYVEILDVSFTRDMDLSWLGALVWEGPAPAGIDEAWNTQKLTFPPRPAVNEWGVLVSAFLPIVKDGKTIGLLGVDYNIAYVNALQDRILAVLIISFILSAALTGALAYAGSRSVLVTIEEREKTAREAVESHTKIEKLLDALKTASENRASFLSGISSSMSDPVNHIIRLSSSLSKRAKITEDHQKNLDIISDEGMKLFSIINDILDVLRIESGTIKYNPVKYKLPKLISDITSTYLLYTENKPINYNLIIDEKLPVNLAGDELRVRQICHRLLTNAFRYTNTGSITVNITSKLKNNYVMLIIGVIDTGVGMTKEKLSAIFVNYGQGSGGLGLFLCKQLAEIMKGTLSVTSEPGKGSAFTLCVPQKLLSTETIGPEVAKKLAAFNFET